VPEAGAVADAAARLRKERVHTSMLIELLSLLIFLSMAFAFVMKEEGENLNPWKEKYDRVAAELEAVKASNRWLRSRILHLDKEVLELKINLRRLLEVHKGTVRPNDQVLVPKDFVASISSQKANAEAVVEELQQENIRLRQQLAAARGGGVDLPKCRIAPGFLFSIDLLGDGRYQVRPQWSAGAADAVAQVPGAMALARGGPFTREEFLAQSRRIRAWGRAQPVPCGFTALVTERHGRIGLYKQQVSTVEQSFYVRRN